MEPLLLSVPDAAKALGISERKTLYLIEDGTIPTVRLGRRRLVRTRDLEEYVDSLTGGGA